MSAGEYFVDGVARFPFSLLVQVLRLNENRVLALTLQPHVSLTRQGQFHSLSHVQPAGDNDQINCQNFKIFY